MLTLNCQNAFNVSICIYYVELATCTMAHTAFLLIIQLDFKRRMVTKARAIATEYKSERVQS